MSDDDLIWLEDIEGERAMEWVRARSAESEEVLGRVGVFEEIRAGIQEALEAEDRIAMVSQVGDHLYNVWTDAEHPRGLWRRTTWESYRTDSPEWEILLDLDALGAEEGVSWVWHGARMLRPTYDRALVSLSPGGSDSDVTREFDLTTRTFVEGGFVRPEGKGHAVWLDRDTLAVATDLGPDTVTSSGYPRQVRRWVRGTDLADAPVLHEAGVDDMAVGVGHDSTEGFERTIVSTALTFWTDETHLLADDGSLTRLDVPDSAETGLHREWLTISLRHDWEVDGVTHPAGSLLVTRLEDFLAGERDLEVAYAPDASGALVDWSWTRHHLLLTTLVDVRHRVEALTPTAEGWRRTPVPVDVPEHTTVAVHPVDARDGDDLWLISTGFLTPTTLSLLSLGEDPATATTEPLKAAPARFDADGLTVTQHFATSEDGTRVPYFQIGPADLPMDGTTPTVMHGYGGFEIPLTPAYDAVAGRAWLTRGGVHVVANIRGGGEYGPRWHQSALREHRHRAYEDFVAVARDLVARGVTSVERLGCTGRSNGGLLVGNMLSTYPEDFGAIVCQVPLLDMQRYHRLLAGASWVAEYGDPESPDDWAFLQRYSAYQRVGDLLEADRPTPPVYLATSTKDDRVHPGHARKLAELLRSHDRDVTYWENTEGGHGGASTAAQSARWHALPWAWLHERLGR